jgi:hypothetical protein
MPSLVATERPRRGDAPTRPASAPPPLTAVLALQRSAGNQAVAKALAGHREDRQTAPVRHGVGARADRAATRDAQTGRALSAAAALRLSPAPAERTLARFNDQLVRERAYQIKDWVEAKVQVRAHEIFTATKRTDEQANYHEAKKQVEEAWQHFTTLKHGGTVAKEQWDVMKLGLSSEEYARARTLLGTALTQAELLELTVGEFDTHRKRTQMDWANADFDDATRKALWEIVDWGLDGLAAIKLADVVTQAKQPESRGDLKSYCEAISGKHGAEPTVELVKLTSLKNVLREGRWVAKLTKELGGPRMRAVMPRNVFKRLIADESVAEQFVDYHKTYRPILQAPSGKDTTSFITLVKDEGGKVADYAGELLHIKNIHKFPRASLDKLKTDKVKAGKPLTLVFQSLFDHNGAFIRHEHVNKVIQNANVRAYAIEGQDRPGMKELADTGIAKLAADYGLDGKITQVMVAGHGNATLISVGGGGSDVEEKGTTGEYKVTEKDKVSVSFGSTTSANFWTAFFEALLSNMETKEGLNPTILLRACLTASNSVDVDKLKAELKTATGGERINVDHSSVDPTTEQNQAKIRAGIVKYIKRHGSLAKVLGDKALGRAEVLGAQSSITAGGTGSIDEKTGQLQIIAILDPMVAAPKIQYVRHGKEPLGAIRAVIESWAENRDECFKQMTERVADTVATDDDFIIQLLYRTILGTYKNDILTANGFAMTASALHGIAAAGTECRPSKLRDDPMTQKHRAAFYPLLLGKFSRPFARLAIYEDWLSLDATKQADVVEVLKGTQRSAVKDYLDFDMLDAHVQPILDLASADLHGRLVLALVGFIDSDKRADCKTFLLKQLDAGNRFSAELKSALAPYSEDELRKSMGLEVAATVTATGAPERKENIAGGGFHVEPMRTTVKPSKAAADDAAKVMSSPKDDATVLEAKETSQDYDVVGAVKTLSGDDAGWFMIRMPTGAVGYMHAKYL